jgi:hypothetical protein
MTKHDIIGANELIFHTDPEKGIYSGGFSVQSILEKSPIVTHNKAGGGGNEEATQVSDLFHHLVIPSGLLSYSKGGFIGGHDDDDDEDDAEEDDDDEDTYYGGAVIENDLYDKLLDLVKPPMRPKTRKNKLRLSKKTKRNRR